jgi:23S rRNA (uracil1939-C5)-methyltransferase
MTDVKSVEVEVRALAAGGSGVADLPDGRVIFVPRTAPGDKARVHIVKDKKRWALGVLDMIERPAPGRAKPACGLYDACGGCSLQHLTYEHQLLWKGRIVSDALQRIGGQDVEPPEVVPAEPTTAYRNRMTFTLRRLRGGRMVAGLHALGRPSHVIDVQGECVLPEQPIREAWMSLRAGWGGGARLLPEGGRLSLTLRSTTDGVILVVEGGEAGWDSRALAEAVPALRSIWHRPSGKHEATTMVAGDASEDVWGEDRFPVHGKAFLQVNRRGAQALLAHVLDMAGEGTRAVDAYCGVGLYGRSLARAGWQATGIELDPVACGAARFEAPDGFDLVEGSVEERIRDALPAELVVLNPPRTGLHADVPAALLEQLPGRIIYVSCDPATLARDTALLGERYSLTSLRAFDLFPQTAHVETVAVFDLQEGS